MGREGPRVGPVGIKPQKHVANPLDAGPRGALKNQGQAFRVQAFVVQVGMGLHTHARKAEGLW